MPIQRLNHAVLYVRDVDRSVTFYTEALGFLRGRLQSVVVGLLVGVVQEAWRSP